MDNKINKLREQIDVVDTNIFELFEKRFKLTNEIMNEKRKLNIPKSDLDRENEIVEGKIKKFKLKEEFIQELYKLIFRESKK